MSKMKDHLERIRQEELEQYVSFMEWVCDQKQEVSVNVTNEEEDSQKEPSSGRSSIVPANTLKAANNINYHPTRRLK